MSVINHQNNFATNITSNTSAGATTTPLNSIPSISAPFYIALDATNINGHYEVVKVTSKTVTNINHAATTYAHTTAEEVRMIIPATEMDSLWNAATNSPQGHLLNGKLSVTVASNNITVALKTLAGTDPSSTDPVYVRIGDTVREITSALSVTKNAGTNWFNSGSSELATKEIDYFVYLGYNATDGVTIGFSRIPYATQYSDFSATTTNEKYCAISTITNATSTDYYENVGRFAATLSATASFNWSVPTYTALNLINRPIFETRKNYFLPVWASSGTQPAIGNGSLYGDYTVQGHRIFGTLYMAIGTTSTVGTGNYTWQLPFKCNSDTYAHGAGPFSGLDSGTQWYMGTALFSAANTSLIGLSHHGNTGGNWSATTPVVPANGDTIRLNFSYEI